MSRGRILESKAGARKDLFIPDRLGRDLLRVCFRLGRLGERVLERPDRLDSGMFVWFSISIDWDQTLLLLRGAAVEEI